MNKIIFFAVLLVACTPAQDEQEGAQPAAAQTDGAASQDSVIFVATMERARAERLDTLPLGEVIARVGRWFVGAPYTPYTLESNAPAERLVINLREFDCVTFVENILVFGRLIKSGRNDFASFQNELRRIRYRGGELNGYPSRLHYFSEWISNNQAKGIVTNVTQQIGGVRDPEPIDFMSTHRDAYRQLADSAVFAAVVEMERELSAQRRYVIPEARIAANAADIRNGDIIAAASNIKGLDVAHTGLAIWLDDRLHLMHAPLVGDSVEISERPLAERIVAIERQDGIMVARPREPAQQQRAAVTSRY